MNILRVFCLLCLAASLLWGGPAAAAPDKPETLLTAWMGEQETFVAWYAKKQGWDREEGFDLKMMPFDTGKNIMESLAAYDWSIAGCGAFPAMTMPLGKYLYVIGIANDESAANAVFVRADSAIARAGRDGAAASVAGAELLCPLGTSAHYLLGCLLQRLVLKESDVRLRYRSPDAALGAFNGGVGAAVALWAPQSHEAEARGYKTLVRPADCGMTLNVLLVANRRFADDNPEKVAAFLRMYMRGVERIRLMPLPEAAGEYMAFIREWTGRDIARNTAEADLASHRLFSREEQLALFENGGLRQSLRTIVDFALSHGVYSEQQKADMRETGHITGRFLKAATRQ